MNQPSAEQIAKLPKWAQDHIKDLQRGAEVALRNLREWRDTQTPAPIFAESYENTGEKVGPSRVKRYIQNHSVVFEWHGVELTVTVPTYSPDEKRIRLSWCSSDQSQGEVAFIPKSYCHGELVARNNMRER